MKIALMLVLLAFGYALLIWSVRYMRKLALQAEAARRMRASLKVVTHPVYDAPVMTPEEIAEMHRCRWDGD